MTRTRRIVAVILAVLMLSALAFAGVAAAKGKDGGTSTFTLVARNRDYVDVDNWAFTAVDDLYESDGQTQIVGGWTGGQCVVVGENAGYVCHMVVRLPEGDIASTALVEMGTTDPWMWAVTGGTGDFSNVRGEIETEGVAPAVVNFTFRLKGATADY